MALKELVRESATSSIAGLAEYSFWHPLIRDVAYGQIPRAARSAKHRAVAGWIERTSGDRLGDRAEFLAHHYVSALSLAGTTGLTPSDDLIEATGRALSLAETAGPTLIPRLQRCLEAFEKREACREPWK